MSDMETIKKGLPYALMLLLGAWAGFFVGVQYFPRTKTRTVEVDKPVIVQGEAQTTTETQIAYVPKETTIIKYIDSATGQEATAEQREAVDLDVQVGKSDFTVRLNGKEAVFNKADNEAYLFEKNKLALAQSSTITIDARIAPQVIDETRRWSIGVGYGDHGMAYQVSFPLGRSAWSGWVYKDNQSKAGGLAINF